MVPAITSTVKSPFALTGRPSHAAGNLHFLVAQAPSAVLHSRLSAAVPSSAGGHRSVHCQGSARPSPLGSSSHCARALLCYLPPALLLPSIQNPSSTNPPSSHRPVLRPGPPRFHCQIGRRVFSSPSSFVCLIDRFRSPPSRPCPPQPSLRVPILLPPFAWPWDLGVTGRCLNLPIPIPSHSVTATELQKNTDSPTPAPTARGQNQPKRRTTTSDPSSSETSPPISWRTMPFTTRR